MSVSENIVSLKARIADACRRAGRRAEEVTVVAVTKGFAASDVEEAFDAGIRDFGENRLQEAEPKARAVRRSGLNWHFMGRIQSNKLAKILDAFGWVQSFADADSLRRAEKHLAAVGESRNALVQVNISGESSKGGFSYEEAGKFFADGAFDFPHLKLRGLMGIGPLTDDREAVRRSFREFRRFFEKVKVHGLDVLSMGMSGDFEIAVEEGSTMLRVGTAIFGERK